MYAILTRQLRWNWLKAREYVGLTDIYSGKATLPFNTTTHPLFLLIVDQLLQEIIFLSNFKMSLFSIISKFFPLRVAPVLERFPTSTPVKKGTGDNSGKILHIAQLKLCILTPY